MTHIVLYSMAFLFSSSVIASGSGDSLIGKNKKAIECYNGTSAGVMNCMSILESEKKQEYEKAYESFIKRTKKEDLNNKNDFITNIAIEKKGFSKNIKHLCRAYSSLNIKDSYAYNTLYSHCMITLYDKKIKFYNEFDYT